MSIADLDPVIHAPKRLGAMAVLAASERATFVFLKEHLEVSDSDLSKQMKALAEAGYVSLSKTGHGRKSSTTFKITKAGRAAFVKHIAALNALVEAGSGATPIEA